MRVSRTRKVLEGRDLGKAGRRKGMRETMQLKIRVKRKKENLPDE